MNLTEKQRLEKWNNEQAAIYIVNDVLLITYIVLGIFGNAIVLIVYKYKMKQNVDDRYFIPWLALLDLLACTFRSSFELSRKINPVNFRGTLLCKLCWIPVNITAFSSAILLLVITFHRYLKVCRPFGQQMTLTWKRVGLGLCIGSSLLPTMVLNVYNKELELFNTDLNVTGYICDIDITRVDPGFFIFVAFASVLVLITLSGLLFLNTLIGRTIYRQLHARKKMTSNFRGSVEQSSATENTHNLETFSGCQNGASISEQNPNREKTEILKENCFSHSFSYMFMMVAIAFCLSYIPQFILLFASVGKNNFWINKSKSELAMLAAIREMNVMNNIINPVIYGYYDKLFRQKTIMFLKCKCSFYRRVYPE
ncbi:CCKAR [Mytilus coruscus]|uniref:CCKAR n=1 Tax=Mytilus coruscus TaxID=42192 RepID=A0A6J8CJD8_MYTCO|nr:CCKAR [Mytilus coruscus]